MHIRRFLAFGLLGTVGVAIAIIGGGLIWRASLQSETRAARGQIDLSTGVDELFKTNIGGIQQWFHVRGLHRSDPVVLWLHGGPGTPMMAFEGMFQKGLENHFIVVQWDQRTAGKTYNENWNSDFSIVNYDRMLADATAVLDMIKLRYAKPKIIVVGHSWGSILGLGVIRARPDDIAAYVGTGQVVDIVRNEEVAYRATLAEAYRLNNSAAIKALNGIAPFPGPKGIENDDKSAVLLEWEQAFGFAISRRYRGSIQHVLINGALRSPEYSIKDVGYFLRDTYNIAPALAHDVNTFDAKQLGTEYRVPMILFLGRFDFQTPSSIAAAWFDTVTAPTKKVIWFANSAHSAMIDEPDAFARAMVDEVRPFALPIATPH